MLDLTNPAVWPTREAYQTWMNAVLEESNRIYQAKRGRNVGSFDDWLANDTSALTWGWHYGPWNYPHLVAIRRELARLEAGEIDRLAIFLHPRAFKSQMVTVRYPVYRLEKDPSLPIIIAGYNDTLALTFGRQTLELAESRSLAINPRRRATGDWGTLSGGGVRAAGVGSGITGRGARLILIDDPIKSRAEANSAAYRERVWRWYTDDLYTRLDPGGAIVLTMTRWHEDDLAGRILGSEEGKEWAVLRIPAFAETQEERDKYNLSIGRPTGEPDPLGREPGEPMNPERYNKKYLERARGVLMSGFSALFQQRPNPPEGDRFKREWFEIVPALPDKVDRVVRYWDKAGSKNKDSAYTAGLLMAKASTTRHIGDEASVVNTYYIVDLVMGQWKASEREKIVKQTADLDYARFGDLLEIAIEQEGGSGGLESAESTVANLAGYRVTRDIPRGDKELRAEPLEAQASIGNVKMVAGPYVQRLLDIFAAFPAGIKDPVDAASGAFAHLTGKHDKKPPAQGKPQATTREDFFKD